jgi:uroporphyrin-III C-methyltransferase
MNIASLLSTSARQLASLPAQGKVYLVGAGPGDPELLTLKAVRVIASASVLLVDDLVNPAVLAYAASKARIIHVGKRGGCASTPQAFIEKLMLAEAKAGETVVRLKGGDPFIFGRGGEELESLRAQGVTVEVVNGITAGLAALSSLGVPLTHRDHAHGVVFITGHAKAENTASAQHRESASSADQDASSQSLSQGSALNWHALGQAALHAKLTLIIYMGLGQCASIQHSLLQSLPAHTPVAAIQNASLPTQKQCVGTLGQLQQDIAAAGLASPCIIVVGDVLKGLAALHADAAPEMNAVVKLA